MNNKFILESLSMDLKRVAIRNNGKSFGMANRFLEEAFKRKREVDTKDIKQYLLKNLENIEKMEKSYTEQLSEKALMYSTLIQNYIQKFI